MVKKILLIMTLIILFVSITALYGFFADLQNITTFKVFVIEQLKISDSLVNDYYSDDAQLSRKAADSIVLTTLKNLGYDHWIEYLKYIDLKIYQANVVPGIADELIVVLNLSKDTAAIAIYTKINGEYVYTNSLKDIVPVQNIKFLGVPQKEYNFMVTEQLLDERFGAFLVDQFIEIFLYMEDNFKSVWKKTKFSQEIYNLHWINPDARPDQWIKILEYNSIQLNNNEEFIINVSALRQKLSAIKDTMPDETDFKLVEEIVTDECYYWSPKYLHFVLCEGVERESSSPVAVIDDTAYWREAFLGFMSNNYQIKTREGNIRFIPKESIIVENKE